MTNVEKFKDLPDGLKVVIGEMMRVVGMTPRQIEKFRFVDRWYQQYAWTEADHDKFGKWLCERVRTDRELRQQLCRRSGRMDKHSLDRLWSEVDLMWGWKVGEKTGKVRKKD